MIAYPPDTLPPSTVPTPSGRLPDAGIVTDISQHLGYGFMLVALGVALVLLAMWWPRTPGSN